jgi:hypothetical protein
MTTMTGRVRRRLLLPGPDEVTFAERGFAPAEPAAQQRLEHTASQFLVGLGHGLASNDVDEVRQELEGVEAPFRGFAYEGAAMGLAIGDAMAPLGRGTTAEFVAGPAAPHVYMVHVGVGWALARLPRAFWRRAVLPDPLLRWLAVDGFGFHQAYFRTPTYVYERRRGRMTPPWPDPARYAARVLDQGIGRAMWFVHGADVERLGNALNGFDPQRHDDVWSGAGLAATYAGGVDAEDLQRLRKLAGLHRFALAQGSAFAAKTRLLADLVTPHTVDAVEVLCGTGVREAALVTDDALLDLPADDASQPAYEVWRQRIQESLRSFES